MFSTAPVAIVDTGFQGSSVVGQRWADHFSLQPKIITPSKTHPKRFTFGDGEPRASSGSVKLQTQSGHLIEADIVEGEVPLLSGVNGMKQNDVIVESSANCVSIGHDENN